MKRDWDARARENARYYVASSRSDWDEAGFSASGKTNAEQLVARPDHRRARSAGPPHPRDRLRCGTDDRARRRYLRQGGRRGRVGGDGRHGERASFPFRQRQLYETNGVDLALFPDSHFDFASSFIVFQHIPFREVIEGYLREVKRVLKPGRLFKFQVQGTSGEKFAAAEKNTWLGVGFSAAEMHALAARSASMS